MLNRKSVLFIISALTLSANLNTFALSCPVNDPAAGSTHGAFTEATLIIGTVPQFPMYKAAVICSYENDQNGNVYPYTTVPTRVTESNWQGPAQYGKLTLYNCVNTDPAACAYEPSNESDTTQ